MKCQYCSKTYKRQISYNKHILLCSYIKTSEVVRQVDEELLYSLKNNFKYAVQGYHIVNKEPIKEARWEEICEQIFLKCDVKVKSLSGSHMSGCDLRTSIGNFSNKSGKIDNGKLFISSYRLTTVCDINNVGNSNTINAEINIRNASYDSYSIIARNSENNYYWYIIPKNHMSFQLGVWTPSYSTRGANKGNQNGWKLSENDNIKATIKFSMSSQLWWNVRIQDIVEFMIASVKIDTTEQKIDYIDLFKSLHV